MLHLGLELKELRGSIEHAGRAKLEELQVFEGLPAGARLQTRVTESEERLSIAIVVLILRAV